MNERSDKVYGWPMICLRRFLRGRVYKIWGAINLILPIWFPEYFFVYVFVYISSIDTFWKRRLGP